MEINLLASVSFSALDIIFNVMGYINSRFTYLFTYLIYLLFTLLNTVCSVTSLYVR